MEKQDYTVSITVAATPQQAFEAINDVAGWWTKAFEGDSEKPEDVFTVRFGETYITSSVVELIPFKKITWLVTDCNKHWLKNKKEWNGTRMDWSISDGEDGTTITFTHIGLVPGIECYNGCEGAWNSYIKESLFKLLSEGKGKPELK